MTLKRRITVLGIAALIPGVVFALYGGVFRAARALPLNIARELALTGDALSAERAERLGLVNVLCEPGRAIDEAVALAERICANGPVAVRQSLRVTVRLWRDPRVRALLLVQWVPPAFVTGAEAVMVPYANGRDYPTSALGLMLGAVPVGMLVGNLVLGRLVAPSLRERLVAPILLKEVSVGGLSVREVPAAVFPDNRLQVGLLGMSFLSKLSHFEVAGGRLVLRR